MFLESSFVSFYPKTTIFLNTLDVFLFSEKNFSSYEKRLRSFFQSSRKVLKKSRTFAKFQLSENYFFISKNELRFDFLKNRTVCPGKLLLVPVFCFPIWASNTSKLIHEQFSLERVVVYVVESLESDQA